MLFVKSSHMALTCITIQPYVQNKGELEIIVSKINDHHMRRDRSFLFSTIYGIMEEVTMNRIPPLVSWTKSLILFLLKGLIPFLLPTDIM